MKTTRTWQILALVAIAALFYVGHGLHQTGSDDMRMSLLPTARGSELIQEDNAGLEWEQLGRSATPRNVFTYRCKVSGGWLICVQNIVQIRYESGKTRDGRPLTASVTFYPDPKHEWDGKSVK